MKRVFFFLAVFGFFVGWSKPTEAITLQAGDLIKGSSSAVYYFGSDGRRYVFPNDKTFFTWYPDFRQVKIIGNRELAALPLGRTNVTYRPGRKMVKLNHDSRVYVVDRGGILRHVTSEALAETFYGLNWQKDIDDLPDPFFTNYQEGPPVQTAAFYDPDHVLTLTTTIAQDKLLDLHELTITIGEQDVGFIPTTFTIRKGSIVRWINRSRTDHTLIGGQGWTSPLLAPGASYTRRFDEVGSFDYSSGTYRAMEGNINVIE